MSIFIFKFLIISFSEKLNITFVQTLYFCWFPGSSDRIMVSWRIWFSLKALYANQRGTRFWWIRLHEIIQLSLTLYQTFLLNALSHVVCSSYSTFNKKSSRCPTIHALPFCSAGPIISSTHWLWGPLFSESPPPFVRPAEEYQKLRRVVFCRFPLVNGHLLKAYSRACMLRWALTCEVRRAWWGTLSLTFTFTAVSSAPIRTTWGMKFIYSVPYYGVSVLYSKTGVNSKLDPFTKIYRFSILLRHPEFAIYIQRIPGV